MTYPWWPFTSVKRQTLISERRQRLNDHVHTRCLKSGAGSWAVMDAGLPELPVGRPWPWGCWCVWCSAGKDPPCWAGCWTVSEAARVGRCGWEQRQMKQGFLTLFTKFTFVFAYYLNFRTVLFFYYYYLNQSRVCVCVCRNYSSWEEL